MKRMQSKLTTTHTITCEGSGLIQVEYTDGRTIDCPIGYVVAHIDQDWHVRARPTSCEEIFVRQGPVT